MRTGASKDPRQRRGPFFEPTRAQTRCAQIGAGAWLFAFSQAPAVATPRTLREGIAPLLSNARLSLAAEAPASASA